ncbi:hypothetical protein HDU81_001767 [Chytriomyces hyalinus]|nr:hypothetical protein HDU81_001767 [Chytriomyces hyalinus]
MCTNYPPDIQGTDHGIWRRIRMIEFISTFTDTPKDNYIDNIYMKDDSMESKIMNEWRPVIMNILIEYFQIWRHEKLKETELPDEISKFTRKYRSEMNVFDAFISDQCIVDKTNADLYIDRDNLERAFFMWVKTSDFKERKVLPKEFKKEMSRRFGHNDPEKDRFTIDGQRIFAWRHICLKSILSDI